MTDAKEERKTPVSTTLAVDALGTGFDSSTSIQSKVIHTGLQ